MVFETEIWYREKELDGFKERRERLRVQKVSKKIIRKQNIITKERLTQKYPI